MTAPRIRPIPAPCNAPDLSARNAVWFVVSSPGYFRERWFDLGDLVACHVGAQHPSSDVVLIPVGRGAPALGAALGGTIVGAYGEPCSPRRWEVLGAIVGRWCWCARSGAWHQVEAAHRPGAAAGPQGAQALAGRIAGAGPRALVPDAPQLSLFARAA